MENLLSQTDIPLRITRQALLEAAKQLGLDPNSVKSFAYIPNGIETVELDEATGVESPTTLDALQVVAFDCDDTGARISIIPGDSSSGYRKTTYNIPVL